MTAYTTDTQFVKCAAFTLLREGPMSNNAYDPGGKTKYGFAQSKHPDINVAALTEAQALQLYYDEYYVPTCANLVNFGFALAIFECAVNQGQGTAVRLWQRAVGVGEDGKPGTVSRSALISRQASPDVLALFMAYRVQAYVSLRDSEPENYAINNKGWYKRLFLCSAAGAY